MMEHRPHNYKAICAYIQAQITDGREGMSEGEMARSLGVDRLDARRMVQEWLEAAVMEIPTQVMTAREIELRDLLESALHETTALRSQVSQAGGFIRELFAHFPEHFPDGFGIQDMAEKHGILTQHKPVVPCGNGCWCDEYYSRDEWDNGEASCLRLSTWLTAVKEGE